jgi:acyl-CoA thioesterase FadM
MNLFFRLLLVFIRARLSGQRIGMLDPTRLKFRVWLTDQDMFAHMTNSRYMSFGDLGTINYILRSGFWPVLRKRGWFPVICAQYVIITRMLSTPQAFELVTRVVGWDDTYVAIEHQYRRGDTVHARMRVVARFASQKRKRVLTGDVMQAMGVTDQSPALPDYFADMISEVRDRRTETRQSEPATG